MYGIRKTDLRCYKSEVQRNLNCWKTRKALVKFPLKLNKAFVAYLEGGGGDDDDDNDKSMRKAFLSDKPSM
jgi:hypothetical protein